MSAVAVSSSPNTTPNVLPAEWPQMDDGLSRLVTGWLTSLTHDRGLAEATLTAYARDLRQMIDWLADRHARAPCLADIAALDLKAVRAFLAHRRRAGLENRSMARALSAQRSFFRWLEETGALRNRTFARIQSPRIPHSLPKPLTIESAAAVVDGGMAAELDWIAARDTAVLLLLYGAGLRVAEALSLTRRQAPGADPASHAGGRRALHRALPLSPRRGCASVPRRAGRPAQFAHRAPCHGAPARHARTARYRHAARVAPFVRDASALVGCRPAADTRIAWPCLAVDDADLHRG
jgi:integrase/recombinase XerC